MLDAQDRARRDSQEKYVGAILRRRMAKGEQFEASRGRSPLPAVLSQLQNGIDRGPSDVLRSTVPNEKQSWVMTVDWALRYIGILPAFVVIARLTRRQKSAERAWEQIQREAIVLRERVGEPAATVYDLKQMYEMALPILATIFEQREISADDGSHPVIEVLRMKCAAIEAGLACPVQAA
jgi:hypothetical protein